MCCLGKNLTEGHQVFFSCSKNTAASQVQGIPVFSYFPNQGEFVG